LVMWIARRCLIIDMSRLLIWGWDIGMEVTVDPSLLV